jgi:hypothetical protein
VLDKFGVIVFKSRAIPGRRHRPLYAADDPFVGYFSGELDGIQYQVIIERFSSTTYDGLLQIDDAKMQLDAKRYGERFAGLLRNHAGELRFRAELQGSALILEVEDGRRIVLWRGNPP